MEILTQILENWGMLGAAFIGGGLIVWAAIKWQTEESLTNGKREDTNQKVLDGLITVIKQGARDSEKARELQGQQALTMQAQALTLTAVAEKLREAGDIAGRVEAGISTHEAASATRSAEEIKLLNEVAAETRGIKGEQGEILAKVTIMTSALQALEELEKRRHEEQLGVLGQMRLALELVKVPPPPPQEAEAKTA
jgi:hypothetical protein